MFYVLDTMLALPTVVIAIAVLAFWTLIALAVHRIIVPALCGPEGRRLGKFEAEVTSQIALAFGLLISFNAVWIWDRFDRVQGAVYNEAAALSRLVDEAEVLSDKQSGDEIRRAIADYTTHLVRSEWPTLQDSSTDRARPAALGMLSSIVRAKGTDVMEADIEAAQAARDVRIRDGLVHMPMPRWSVVTALAILLLISIGALHGDAPQGRKLALSLVTLAVTFCFVVLFANARPFVGEYAIKPTDLENVLFRAMADQ